MSLRVQNCLLIGGVNSLDDLLKLSTEDLSEMHNLGQKGIYEVQSILKKWNIDELKEKKSNIDELMDIVSRAKTVKETLPRDKKRY